MNNPKVSVIVPVYNAEKTLHCCLDSIIAQTYTDWECILIDDGSKDNSPAICDEYEKVDTRFKVIHKKNGGASSARNVGLKEAKGEWICFCDADDFAEVNWLSVFSDNMLDNDMVIASVNQLESGKSIKRTFPDCSNSMDIIWTIMKLEGGPGFLWNKCFRNNIIRKYQIRFNETYKIWEDEEFVSRYMIYAISARMCSCVTYNYVAPDFGDKYDALKNFDTLLEIYSNTKKIISNESPLRAVHVLDIKRMLGCVQVSYRRGKYRQGYKYLKKVRDLMIENNVSVTSKIEKVFSLHHPNISNVLCIVMAKLHFLE